MRLSEGLRSEIDFLSKGLPASQEPFTPTEEEIREYIDYVSHGKESSGIVKNRLFQARKAVDFALEGYEESIVEGYFSFNEVDNAYEHPYWKKRVRTLARKLDFRRCKHCGMLN